jgi:SAM-dependent methyltransferase
MDRTPSDSRGIYLRDERYHDGVAAQYDHLVVNPRIYTIGILFEGFAQAFGGRDSMLDLGCGTGHMLLRYAERFRSALGVDHSAGMLAAARANLIERGLGHVVLIKSDLNQFARSCCSPFDLISCVGVLHHLVEADRQALLRQLRALCSERGRIVLAEPVEVGAAPDQIEAWNRQALGGQRQYQGEIPEDPDEAPLDEDRWRAMISEAGFAVEAESRMWEMSTTTERPGPNERERIRRLVADHPGGNVLAFVLRPG